MKTVAKHTLLFGAFTMLLSTLPLQAAVAEEETFITEEMPVIEPAKPAPKQGLWPRIRNQITIRQHWLAGLTDKEKDMELKRNIKAMDRAFDLFMQCKEKGKKPCVEQANAVRFYVIRILALVGLAAVTTGTSWLKKKFKQEKVSEKLIDPIKDYLNKPTLKKYNAIAALLLDPSVYSTATLQEADELFQKSTRRNNKLHRTIQRALKK